MQTQESLGRARQAVILAGGRGTRLGSLTERVPKPMVMFHGRPFLEYLIEMLRDQGFQRVLLLLGYLPDVITSYFGNGSRWGMNIQYSISSPDELTGGRMRRACSFLDPHFLLMYCDNYWPLDADAMWMKYVQSGAAAMLTVYSNRDGYTRNNVRVGSDGYIETFDRTRTQPTLQGVDIGYGFFSKSLLDRLPPEDVMVEEVYPSLIRDRQLIAHVTDHRYYSVGSVERLALTEQFLARRPAVLLDRDGVLNRRPPRAEYVRTPADFMWLPGALEALRTLREAGYLTIVITNQAGIGRGVLTHDQLDAVHQQMKAQAEAAGGHIDAIYVCPHDWNAGCECRKPKPGMLLQAHRDFSLDLTRVIFVGDDERDEAAAHAAGCRSLLVNDNNGLLEITRELVTRNSQTLMALA